MATWAAALRLSMNPLRKAMGRRSLQELPVLDAAQVEEVRAALKGVHHAALGELARKVTRDGAAFDEGESNAVATAMLDLVDAAAAAKAPPQGPYMAATLMPMVAAHASALPAGKAASLARRLQNTGMLDRAVAERRVAGAPSPSAAGGTAAGERLDAIDAFRRLADRVGFESVKNLSYTLGVFSEVDGLQEDGVAFVTQRAALWPVAVERSVLQAAQEGAMADAYSAVRVFSCLVKLANWQLQQNVNVAPHKRVLFTVMGRQVLRHVVAALPYLRGSHLVLLLRCCDSLLVGGQWPAGDARFAVLDRERAQQPGVADLPETPSDVRNDVEQLTRELVELMVAKCQKATANMPGQVSAAALDTTTAHLGRTLRCLHRLRDVLGAELAATAGSLITFALREDLSRWANTNLASGGGVQQQQQQHAQAFPLTPAAALDLVEYVKLRLDAANEAGDTVESNGDAPGRYVKLDSSTSTLVLTLVSVLHKCIIVIPSHDRQGLRNFLNGAKLFMPAAGISPDVAVQCRKILGHRVPAVAASPALSKGRPRLDVDLALLAAVATFLVAMPPPHVLKIPASSPAAAVETELAAAMEKIISQSAVPPVPSDSSVKRTLAPPLYGARDLGIKLKAYRSLAVVQGYAQEVPGFTAAFDKCSAAVVSAIRGFGDVTHLNVTAANELANAIVLTLDDITVTRSARMIVTQDNLMRVPGDTAADVAANDAPLDIATLAADGSVAVARELVSFLSLLPRGTTDGDHARDLTRLRCAADFALRGYGAAFRDVTNVLLSAYVPRALEVVRDRLKRKERTELDVRLLTRFIFSSALLEHAFVVLPMHLKASEDGALGAVRVAAIIDDGAALGRVRRAGARRARSPDRRAVGQGVLGDVGSGAEGGAGTGAAARCVDHAALLDRRVTRKAVCPRGAEDAPGRPVARSAAVTYREEENR
jgi:hypothetical protein